MKLLSTAAAAESLSLTVAQFSRLAAAEGIQPDDTYVNPHHKSGPPAKLWSRRRLAALKRSRAVQAAVKRKWGSKPKDYNAGFTTRYGSARAALGDACQALFNLNRYTRHRTCSDANRRAILRLKSALIEHLYRAEKFTDRVEELTRQLPERECHGCDGAGCERCGYTGVWSEAEDVSTYVFTFTVDNQQFTWMAPDNALRFTPTVEKSRPDDGERRRLDTEINIPRSRLAEAKALVLFALGEKAKEVISEIENDRAQRRCAREGY